MSFFRRNLACARLAVISQFEYRFNLFADAVLQPVLTALIELSLWSAIFTSTGRTVLAGYTKEYYLAYALWASFFGRISTSWMYEFRMIEEIDSGSINSILVRPISFYEYYLSQFLGYKFLTTFISLLAPLSLCVFIKTPTHFDRIPLALALAFFYLVLVHTISFCVASFGFFINRVSSFTVAKNIALTMCMGDLFPLDLLPNGLRQAALALPFASGVYYPVGYMTGRVNIDSILYGFASVSVALVFFLVLAKIVWTRGRMSYSGTGA